MNLLFVDPECVYSVAKENLVILLQVHYGTYGARYLREHEHEKPVFDFNQDAGLIYASLLSEYGLDFYKNPF